MTRAGWSLNLRVTVCEPVWEDNSMYNSGVTTHIVDIKHPNVPYIRFLSDGSKMPCSANVSIFC